MKLIDKSALVAEIEKRRKEIRDIYYDTALSNYAEFAEVAIKEQMRQYDSLLSFIDVLEVKEKDLDKEFSYKDYIRFFEEHPNLSDDWGFEETWIFAKYFFELGLKAQHDNWKVVDNINLPQPDKNKIYCVLSKNKYLLARVINHPQDDDLLKWKCTEFPFHRYDMCEGDKYMQIV